MKKYWNIALILSIIIHLSFFLGAVPFFKKKKIFGNKDKVMDLEIISEENKADSVEDYLKDDLAQINNAPPPYIDNFMEKMLVENDRDAALRKPQIIEKNIGELVLSDEIITIAKDKYLNKELSDNLDYMEYYNIIHNKIIDNMYKFYNSRGEEGRIYLRFIVLSDGQLKDAFLSKETKVSPSLIKDALEGIKQSSPFPPFPKEIAKNHKYLDFDILIDFKSK